MRGRYSIIGLKPDIIWRARGEKAEINRQALLDTKKFDPLSCQATLTFAARIDRRVAH